MNLLNKINSPKDIKQLNKKQLASLCSEIREFLIVSLSKTGGHLASNLGVVELTVALHYCFNTPTDKIVWDVGHQAYVHKILTGRKGLFGKLRKLNGLSGFPKPSESQHDMFLAGHSSTSISVGLGFCAARELDKAGYSVVSVIGDGAMTGGLAFEALNNASRLQSNFIVILNDNEMSIQENVGGISRVLTELRTAPTYLGAKADVSKILKKIPLVGEDINQLVERAKNSLRYFLLDGAMFSEFGFKYVGPIDGHNLPELISVLNRVKRIKGPVLVHVNTKKGKGYEIAEKMPDAFHGVEPFDIKTGKPINKKTGTSFSDTFGNALIDVAKANSKVVAITAAMQGGTGLNGFQKVFPNRIFDVGIAEGHAVTFAAGLAKSGYVPVFAVYSTFLQRAYDQIVHDVCIEKLPVVFAIDRAGVVGADGATHQGLFDLTYLGNIPNMTVLAPKNGTELKQMLSLAITLNSPVAIRYPRENVSDKPEDVTMPVEFGKAEVLIEGKDIAILSVGTMTATCLSVCNRLKEEGLNPTLINPRFIKPLDNEMVSSLRNYKYVFTVEDNVLQGGFSTMVCAGLAQKGICVHRFTALGFPDTFVEQGERKEIFALYKLDDEGIYNKIIEVINE